MAETNPTAIIAPAAVNGTNHINTSIPQPQQTATQPIPPNTTSETKSDLPKQADKVYHSNTYPVFKFPSNLPTPPFIDIDGIPNFRDLGGYLSTTTPTIVRPHMFYRCAQPTQMSPQGLNQLTQTLGIKAVYDLRSGPEIARTTAGAIAAADAAVRAAIETDPDSISISATPPALPYTTETYNSIRHFTPVYATQDTGPEALARKLRWYNTPSSPTALPYTYSEGFVNAYRDIATHGAPAYKAIFQHILTRPTDPLLFHCTAGKDRTGVFAALLLRLAGVDDETIAWEYALTEPGLGDWRLQFIARMSGGGGLHGQQSEEKMTREDAARVCGSRGGNIRAWMTLVLDGEFGGVDRYLTERCGFSGEEIEAIRRNLVVEREGRDGEVVMPCEVNGWSVYGGCVDADV